jgi:hypothetical protein
MGSNAFLQSISVPSVFEQLVLRRQAPSQTHFDPMLTSSMERDRKLREGE